MKKCGFFTICLLAVLSVIITSCSTESPTETPALVSTETVVIETVEKSTSTPTATPTPEPIPCTVAFETDRDGNWEVYKTNLDGSGTVNLTNNPGVDYGPAYSPDGDQIAFVSNRENGDEPCKFIYVMNADGSGVRQLTHEDDSESPDWSHDGTMITYSDKGEIYIIKADGSKDSINLTNSEEEDLNPTWSPDGTKIAWLVANQWGQNAFVMDADGSNIIQVGNNNRSFRVEWTPDGRLFTTWSWDGQEEICQNCIVNIDGSNIIDAGGKGEIVNYFAIWTATGKRVELVETNRLSGNDDIFLIGGDLPDTLDMGIGSINLSNHPANDRSPDAPINCGGGWVVDTEALEANAEASSQPDDNPNITIGYAGDDADQWQRKSNFQKACDELAIQCEYGEIADLLNKKVSAIVLNSSPDKIKNAASAISEATEKGIPVMVLDAEIDMDGVYTIMADQGEMMRVTLDELFTNSGGAGELAFFDFDPAQKDTEIMTALLAKEYPKIKLVATDTKRYNFVEDEFVFSELLTAYPTLKAVWTNDGYTNAIFGIVNNISDPNQYPMITCEPSKDGFFIWKDRAIEHPGFTCVAVSNPPGIAYNAVYAAHYLVSGEKIDESVLSGEFGNAFYVDFPVITDSNLIKELKNIEYENGNYVVDQLMTPDEITEKWFK
ncbi:MAG: substrate-binding domain-containing protein [Anaerolineae bacterium]|nr:substrate-binding domain-containing protein [Anaerolineae bacterium]